MQEKIIITSLPDGGCSVDFESETSHYSSEEVDEMKQDYLCALTRIYGQKSANEEV